MTPDFQDISEPLIKATFPDSSSIRRIDESRGVVHLEFENNTRSIRLSWEPYGTPWALIRDSRDGDEQVRIDSLETDDILISPQMKIEMETRELLKTICQRLK